MTTGSDCAYLKAGACGVRAHIIKELFPMLQYALIFLIVAIIAAIFGFAGLAGTAAWIAKVLFVVFLVLFLVSILTRGRTPSV